MITNKIKQIIREEVYDYRGHHTAPTKDDGPLYDLTEIFGEDIYSPQAARYFGHIGGRDPIDKKSVAIIQSLRDKPNAPVRIYRAVPDTGNGLEINPGDWVTINKDYAKHHGYSQLDDNYKILEKVVKASDLYTDGNSIHEFGYNP